MVDPNLASNPNLILPEMEMRSLSLWMPWPELLTVTRKLRDPAQDRTGRGRIRGRHHPTAR